MTPQYKLKPQPPIKTKHSANSPVHLYLRFVPALQTMLKPDYTLHVSGKAWSDARVQVMYQGVKVDGLNVTTMITVDSMAAKTALWLRSKGYANDDPFRYSWEWGNA